MTTIYFAVAVCLCVLLALMVRYMRRGPRERVLDWITESEEKEGKNAWLW